MRRAFSEAWAQLEVEGEPAPLWARLPPRTLARLLAGAAPEELHGEGPRAEAAAEAAAGLLRALAEGGEDVWFLLSAVAEPSGGGLA